MADSKTNIQQQAAAQPAAQAAAAPKPAGVPGIAALQSKLMHALKAGPQSLDICTLNYALMVIIGCLFILFILTSYWSWTGLQKASAGKDDQAVSPAASPSGLKEIATMKGVAYYIGKLAGKDIFHRKAKLDGPENEPVFSSKMAEMTKDLKLVGISMSDNPDAMIEDTQLQRTFFVKTGSMIGELRIVEITKDKIVLKYNKEQFELK